MPRIRATIAAAAVLLTAVVPGAALGSATGSGGGPTDAEGPVAPKMQTIDLTGVEASAVATAAAVSPVEQAASLQEEGIALASLDERPEVLTGPVEVERFDAVGVTWDRRAQPTTVVVWVRVREAGGWSAWHRLGGLDGGPDDDAAEAASAGARTGTEPLLTSGADAVQVRVDAAGGRRLGHLRAELVDAGPSSAAGPVPAAASTFAAAPAGSPAKPAIISRAQWGADESLRNSGPSYAAVLKVGVIHHTVTTNSYAPSSAAAQVRSIYAYHTQSLGWDDIAYNVLVDQYGQIFEGRFGGLERAVIGAATGGFNTSTFSVSALGNFEEIGAPPAMEEAIARILAWRFAIGYVNPAGTSQLTSGGHSNSRYSAGDVVTFANISSHRDASFTACPGRYLYGDVDAIRYRVFALLRAGLDHPAAATTPRTTDANGAVRITSGLLYGGDWAVEVRDGDGALMSSYFGTGWGIDVTWPMVNSAGLPAPNGTYQVTVKSTQNGTQALDFVTNVSTTSVVGNLDSVSLAPSGALAAGWASMSDGGQAMVTLTVDGDSPTEVAADGVRPDVGQAFPLLGPFRGFSAPVEVPPGVHQVCAAGERPGSVPRRLGCRLFSSPPDEPFGNIDRVSAVDGGLRIAGWALDRHTANSLWVRVYVDGRYAGDPTAALSRPDVRAAYPGYGLNRGFDLQVNTAPGTHHVCVNGHNVGPGTPEGFLACVVGTTTSGPPTGQFDALGVGPNSVTAAGWTFDPDTTAPISVHLYVDGQFAGAFPAGGARPDLAGPFPFMGTGHGFNATVGMATAGHHTVCAYAINAGPPGPNPLLGCRSFG